MKPWALQEVYVCDGLSTGVGLTVTDRVKTLPTQAPGVPVGVTVYTAVAGLVVVLVRPPMS